MFRFIVFIGVVLLLSLIALFVWWIANKINISIKRKNDTYEMEQEIQKKIKNDINKEDK